LNQCDADVEFWRIYAAQASKASVRLAALINLGLSRALFPKVYRNVGHIVSVCEEDRQLTAALAHNTKIDVIENGVDCSYYAPNREERQGPPRMLFTGTSVARNMRALHYFVREVLPLVLRMLPSAELLVAGSFRPEAQAEFATVPQVRFTGRVDDIRPYFDQSDLFVAPFQETHGSKLKLAEAMAMGMAIVSTPQGIRGMPLINNESVLVAQNPVEFAQLTTRLLLHRSDRQKLGEAARRKALQYLDWPVLGKHLCEIVQLVQKRASLPLHAVGRSYTR
jgi:glycosyltransferase involved in cell wall biosynthesis